MKALACILLGVIIAAYSFLQLIEARATGTPVQAAGWFVAIVLGLAITLWGLIANHRSHNRR